VPRSLRCALTLAAAREDEYATGVSSRADKLKEVPIFALLDDQEREALAERVDEEHFKAGTALFNHGEPGDAMYIVVAGAVEIFFKNDTGEKIVLETARAGDFFGEISLLDQGPRTASAHAVEDVHAIVIDRADLDEFIKARPAAALDLLAAAGRRLRESAKLLRHTASRNINEETEDKRSTVQRVADWIADFSGSLAFLFIHVGLFAVWIGLNVGPLPHLLGSLNKDTGRYEWFDPFPFGLLTMCVSLEAIILSVFVLLSQNRQVARERVRNDIEYDVNLKAEMQIAHMHIKIDDMNALILSRLDKLEKAFRGEPSKRGG
jgi:CRP/FNR family cyclic AMP-dependent transcriptional regulator